MWRNYLKIAWRDLVRNKTYTAINLGGLAVGFASCILIALHVYGEFSYDQFHEDADKIYRVESVFGDVISLASVNYPFVEVLETEYPEFAIATFWRSNDNGAVRRENRVFREEDILYANSALFDVFSFRLERGNETTALAEPYTVILTREMARKYFGEENPVGKTLQFFGEQDFTVTGVLAPPPGPTHLPLKIVLSWPTLMATGWDEDERWSYNNTYTYIRFPSPEDAETLEVSLPDLIERHAGDNWPGSTLNLRPLPDIYLYSNHSNELAPGGNPAYVRLFAIVALFILLLAAINFINLATARSAERAQEVAVRKASGADHWQLIAQHLCESVGLAILSGFLALGLARAAIPVVSQLIGASFSPEILFQPFSLLVLVGVILTTGLLAGAFPAFALSSYGPADVLRGRFTSGRGGAHLRRGLVVFQFTVAIALLVGTFVVYGQLQYLRSADLGFDQAQVLSIQGPGTTTSQRLAFFEALKAETAVERVASSTEPMPAMLTSGENSWLPGVSEAEAEDRGVFTRLVGVSADFFETLGVSLLAGRNFRPGSASDSASVIINQAAAQQLMEQVPSRYASPKDLVGERISGLSRQQVLGVVENFHMTSLQSPIVPIAFFLENADATYLVRTAPGAVESALGAVQEHWAGHFPHVTLDYRFVDDTFGAAYRAEQQLGRLAILFAGLAILVGCLGLFGLTTYAAERRRKEIGIRKALGATTPSVVILLSKDFLKLVLIAFAIAAPVAYYAMSRWLENFAYRIELGPSVFIGAGLLALVVALTTVSYQAVRAALVNPVDALRYE